MGNNYRADPGTSNKISDITCLPKETNIFKITSIKTVGCSGKKNVFNLYGEWEDETNLPTLDFDPEFYLSNENKDLVECDYDITEKYMMCEFQGNGKIKIIYSKILYNKKNFKIYKQMEFLTTFLMLYLFPILVVQKHLLFQTLMRVFVFRLQVL